MTKSKKILSVLVAAAILTSLAGCGSNGTAATTTTAAATAAATEAQNGGDADTGEEAPGDVDEADDSGDVEEGDVEADDEDDEEFDADEYTVESQEVYEKNLGEFKSFYDQAMSAANVSERYAYMALAEAKLLESGVFVPLTTRGGRYAISRVAPYTGSPVLWGNDNDRFHNLVVATELIKAEDRAEMKARYAEIKGTGTYEQWVKDFLVGRGYTIKDTYNLPYNTDPVTWDALATSLAADSEAIVNTYDGLVEYDGENVLQPALAESYSVSDDGLTYTFKIRQGVKWVDSQGRELDDVKADDFVAGMQHMMDAMGGLEYLIEGIIVNASEYIGGQVDDFSEVGVKAVDDYTLEYTLCQPTSYFVTMLSYNVFAPLCRSYYESKGGAFGADYNSDCEYGTSPDAIAYCGPYLVTNSTEKNTIVFSANPSYWNKDKINIKTITWYFDDSSDITKAYNDAIAGTIDGVSLNTSTLVTAKADGVFDEYSYISATDATTFNGFINLNRKGFANYNDDTKAVSAKTPEQRKTSAAALANANMRLAICFAIDRSSHNAQNVGEDLKYASMRNTYTPGTFVSLAQDVTISINGSSVSFPAGTNYGAIIQAQLDADGIPIKAYDPDGDDGVGSSDGYDGWYSPENAKAFFNKAAEELAAEGVNVGKDNPVIIDIPFPGNIETYTNRANVLKQSVEASLDGAVIVNLVQCADASEWYNAGYYPDTGYEMNYDFCDVSGWGPDYGDPQTFLDTMLPDYAGYMTKAIGIF